MWRIHGAHFHHNECKLQQFPCSLGGEHWRAQRSEGQNGWTYLRSERLLTDELLNGTPQPTALTSLTTHIGMGNSSVFLRYIRRIFVLKPYYMFPLTLTGHSWLGVIKKKVYRENYSHCCASWKPYHLYEMFRLNTGLWLYYYYYNPFLIVLIERSWQTMASCWNWP